MLRTTLRWCAVLPPIRRGKRSCWRIPGCFAPPSCATGGRRRWAIVPRCGRSGSEVRSVKRLLMVVNPHAGKQHFKGKLLDLIDICTRQGYDTTVLTTQGRGDAAGMVRERAALYEKIICCGGDGTLNEVISGLMACPPQARPPLGYIPAGPQRSALTGTPLRPAGISSRERRFPMTSAASTRTAVFPISPLLGRLPRFLTRPRSR